METLQVVCQLQKYGFAEHDRFTNFFSFYDVDIYYDPKDIHAFVNLKLTAQHVSAIGINPSFSFHYN